MNYSQLIDSSKAEFAKAPYLSDNGISVFEHGALWMYKRMNSHNNQAVPMLDNSIQYTIYGLLKYGICIVAFIVSWREFYQIHFLLTPLSIIIFYSIEVHFLFLFPLVLDRVPHPLLASIRQTYKIGYCSTLFTVMRLGGFMVAGLFNPKTPYNNWHIGCLAVIIWYQHEVRNRIQTTL